MFSLLAPPPESVEVDGQECPVHTDFRAWIQFELLMVDPGLSASERIALALERYVKAPQQDPGLAVDALLWFYRCGKAVVQETPQDAARRRVAPSAARVYDYEQDAGLIYAAFVQTYGIDLYDSELHWWKFRALFDALPSDTKLAQVMGYRAADTSKLPKEEKERIGRLKRLFALDGQAAAKEASLNDRNQRMMEYVKSRASVAEMPALPNPAENK